MFQGLSAWAGAGARALHRQLHLLGGAAAGQAREPLVDLIEKAGQASDNDLLRNLRL